MFKVLLTTLSVAWVVFTLIYAMVPPPTVPDPLIPCLNVIELGLPALPTLTVVEAVVALIPVMAVEIPDATEVVWLVTMVLFNELIVAVAPE